LLTTSRGLTDPGLRLQLMRALLAPTRRPAEIAVAERGYASRKSVASAIRGGSID